MNTYEYNLDKMDELLERMKLSDKAFCKKIKSLKKLFTVKFSDKKISDNSIKTTVTYVPTPELNSILSG